MRLGLVIDRISHRDDGVVELHTDAGETMLTRTMIITAGHGAFNPRKLGLEELEQFEGRGVHYFVKEKERSRASAWRWWVEATPRWIGRWGCRTRELPIR